MNRGLWFVAGAGFGIYSLTKARRVAEAFTPEGLRERMAGLSLGAHLFNEELKTEMAIKENELRRRMGPELSEARTAIAVAGSDKSAETVRSTS